MAIFNFNTGGDQIISNQDNGNGNLDVQVGLFRNGLITSAFGYLDGIYVKASAIPNGDSNADVIIMNNVVNNTGIGPAWRAAIIWDEQTQTNFNQGPDGIAWENLYGGGRYGLPSANATVRYETILGSSGDDMVKLDYNAANGGIAYSWDISVFGGAGRDIIVAGEGNDWLDGGTETSGLGDGIWGQGGDDVIFGGLNGNPSANQNDDLFGGSGNDTIYGSTFYTDEIWGDEGNDIIYGSSFSGGVMGANSGNDTIYGGNGDDTMIGGDGADRFFGGNGTDPFASQPGVLDPSLNDTVSFEFATAGVVANLETRAGTAGEANGDQYTQVENLVGSNFNDTLTGSSTLVANITQSINNTLSGLAGDDVLFGGAGNDTLFGGADNDSLSGNADVDVIFGGTGADTISGGSGGDTLYGGSLGEGNWITYATTPAGVGGIGVTVNIGNNGVSGAGTHAEGDVIANFDNIIGSGFADSLTGNLSNNIIFGGGGVDTIRGGNGADSMVGGGDGDWLDYRLAGAGVTASLLTGVASGGHADGDTFSGFANLIGSENSDSLSGDAGANTIYGGTGNDTIQGGDGGDSLAGGGEAGDFVSYADSASGVTLNLATNVVTGGYGTGDSLSGFLNAIGSTAADSIVGTGGVNTILGGGGNDTIEGGAGADSLDGGAGTGDFISYATSSSGVNVTLVNNVVANGDAAGDTLANFENIIGSSHGDGLTGGTGSNTIYGGDGDDQLDGLAGDDTLYGGIGQDFAIYGNSPVTGVTVNLALNTATGGQDNDKLFQIEHVSGSNFADTLTGDGQANSLVGNGGNDSLLGGQGGDFLFGGIGNDVLRGEDGLDTLDGGGDNDLFILNSDANVVPVSGWDGDAGSAPISVTGISRGYGDSAFGGSGIDTLDLSEVSNANTQTIFQFNNWNTLSPVGMSGIEIIIAGTAADVINLTFNDGVTRTAYGESVTIYAGAGADTVFSGSGDDVIVGGRQNGTVLGEAGDWLYGGQGRDTIYGDDLNAGSGFGGADRLFGGGGNDTLEGGVGGDTLYGGDGIDALTGGLGDDFLYDFDAGDLNGDEGADILVLQVTGTPSTYFVNGGKDDASDGADQVFVGGTYNGVTSGLGAGNDRFIASNSDSGTAQIDRVFGESGNDVVSTWYGNDIIDGDDGNDALWGGAGVDTIMGGPGSDYLYGGAGNGDLLVGGDGTDYYYFARTDGIDRIEDRDTVAGGEGDNYIVVMPDIDPLTSEMRVGSGVFETDHDLYDNAGGDDMVQIVDLDGAGAGTMYRLTILQGPGAGSSIEFDQREINGIALWNNDAATGTPVATFYMWDPVDQRYEYQA